MVDHGHELWIRSLNPTSPWLDRLIKQPDVEASQSANSIAEFRATPFATPSGAYEDQRPDGRALRLGGVRSSHKFEDRDEVVPVYLDPSDLS